MLFYQVLPGFWKKLVLVLATFTPMIKASRENKVILKKVSYIHYPFCFCKDKKNKMRDLIDSDSKVNAMTSTYVAKLGLNVCQTNIGAQKIDGSTLQTFRIVLASF